MDTARTIQEFRDVWSAYAAYYGWHRRSFDVLRLESEGCFKVYPSPGT
jgi:hypothetical protein